MTRLGNRIGRERGKERKGRERKVFSRKHALRSSLLLIFLIFLVVFAFFLLGKYGYLGNPRISRGESFSQEHQGEKTEHLSQSGGEVRERIPVHLIRVVDGDTLLVFFNGKRERVRLIGIDSPESVKPEEEPECYGPEAKEALERFLQGEREIFLEFDETQGMRDRFGRILAYAFLPNGKQIGEMMIEKGYACEYRYALPYRYEEAFRQAEERARQEGLGLWSACPSPC